MNNLVSESNAVIDRVNTAPHLLSPRSLDWHWFNGCNAYVAPARYCRERNPYTWSNTRGNSTLLGCFLEIVPEMCFLIYLKL